AGERPPPEERTGLQAEKFVVVEGVVVGKLEPGAVVLEERFGSSCGPRSQDSAIDDLDVGRVGFSKAIGIEGPGIRSDRSRRSRGAVARGPGGLELGIALV